MMAVVLHLEEAPNALLLELQPRPQAPTLVGGHSPGVLAGEHHGSDVLSARLRQRVDFGPERLPLSWIPLPKHTPGGVMGRTSRATRTLPHPRGFGCVCS